MSGRGPGAGRVLVGVGLGTLLLQLAWIAAVPGFRGADEVDHAYKADAVAAGELRGRVDAVDGRGQLLSVRPGVVQAASGRCEAYSYTGPDNCRAVGPAADGRVLVASAAASYNPSWYAAAGSLARFVDGHAFLVALRVVGAAAVSVLLGAAAALVATRSRTIWPLLALGVSVTPTLLLAGGTAGPNGVSYAAGVLWWASALTVVDARRPAWGRLTLASVLLVATHTLDLLWLPLMTLAVLALAPLRSWPARLRSRPARAAVATVVVAGLASVAWVRLADTNRLGEPQSGMPPLTVADLLGQQLVWTVQTVSTGPVRDDQAPLAVLGLWLVVLVPLLVLGLRAADRRVARAGAVVLVGWVAVPVVLTLASYASEGFAWQGRYALPLVVGLAVLAGSALDRKPPPRPTLLHVAVGTIGLAQVVAVLPWVTRLADDRLGWQLTDVVPVPVALLVVAATATAGVGLVVRTLVATPRLEAVRAA